MLRTIFLLVITLFLIPFGISQTTKFDQDNTGKFKVLISAIPDHYALIDKGSVDFFGQFLDETSYYSFDSLALKKMEIKEQQQRKEWGLRGGVSVLSNDYEKESWDIDYQSRAAINLEWDLIENGWYKNRQDAQSIQQDQEILIAENLLSSKKRLYPNRYNQLVWAFNKEKIGLLNQAISFLDSLESIQTCLYHTHDLPYSALTSTKEKKAAYRVMLQTYTDYNTSFILSNKDELTTIETYQLPLVTLPIESLVLDDEEALLLSKISESKVEKIRIENNSFKRHQLKVSAAYNYTFDNNIPRNSHFSFGIRYKVPIVFDAKIQKEAIALEVELEAAQNDFVLFNRRKELMNHFQEYQYKIKQYLQFVSKRTELIEKIRIEKVLLKHNKGSYSPMLLFHYYTQFQQVQLELIDIKQMLYLNLLQIYSKTFVPDFIDLLEEVHYEQLEKKLPGKRIVAISQKVANHNYDFLMSYLVKNELTDFYAASGINIDLTRQLSKDGLKRVDLATVDLVLETIDCSQFDTRRAYELFISDKIIQYPYKSFLILNLDKLIELEQKSLAFN